jgi:hypothetical protein
MKNTEKINELRAEAKQLQQDRAESRERCGADGFVTQWASDICSSLRRAEADILEDGGLTEFTGLWQDGRRVKARLIDGKWGSSWLLHEDEAELIQQRGRKFLPCGKTSRIQSDLGLTESFEMAPGQAQLEGNGGKGLAGAMQCRVSAFRTGDKWGQDATKV